MESVANVAAYAGVAGNQVPCDEGKHGQPEDRVPVVCEQGQEQAQQVAVQCCLKHSNPLNAG